MTQQESAKGSAAVDHASSDLKEASFMLHCNK